MRSRPRTGRSGPPHAKEQGQCRSPAAAAQPAATHRLPRPAPAARQPTPQRSTRLGCAGRAGSPSGEPRPGQASQKRSGVQAQVLRPGSSAHPPSLRSPISGRLSVAPACYRRPLARSIRFSTRTVPGLSLPVCPPSASQWPIAAFAGRAPTSPRFRPLDFNPVFPPHYPPSSLSDWLRSCTFAPAASTLLTVAATDICSDGDFLGFL